MNELISEKSKIVPFGYDDQLVRTIMIDDVPWFVAKDVCDALDLSNARKALVNLKEDEKITVTTSDGNPRKGIPHQLNVINEPGLSIG